MPNCCSEDCIRTWAIWLTYGRLDPPPHNICPNIIIQNIEGLCTSSPLGTDLSQSRLRSKSYGTIILHPPTSFSKPRHPIFSQQKIFLRALIKKFAFRSTDPLVFLLLPLLAALFIIREDFTLAEFLLTKINGLPTDYTFSTPCTDVGRSDRLLSTNS